MDGCGNAVCFIVNDLTNRELIRRKFTFIEPSIHSLQGIDAYEVDDVEENDVI